LGQISISFSSGPYISTYAIAISFEVIFIWIQRMVTTFKFICISPTYTLSTACPTTSCRIPGKSFRR
jgi:hypothetical protein